MSTHQCQAETTWPTAKKLEGLIILLALIAVLLSDRRIACGSKKAVCSRRLLLWRSRILSSLPEQPVERMGQDGEASAQQ
jgi:hypothetical protein